MKSRAFEGIWIPAEVMRCEDMTIDQKLVFSMVSNLSTDSEPCYASNQYIGKILGIHPTRVSVHINNLKKLGFIKVLMERDKKAHVTKRLLYPIAEMRFRIAPLSGTANGVSDGNLISGTAKEIIKSYNKEYNKDTDNSIKIIKDREGDEAFELFWKTIPSIRRINKPLTKKHWQEAVHKESVGKIQGAMELFVERVEPQFIKTSYNWLKEERWKAVPPKQEKVRKGFEYV